MRLIIHLVAARGTCACARAERASLHTEPERTGFAARRRDFTGFAVASRLHAYAAMTTRDPALTSYDDIARATVPNPDGSFQPTRAQVRNSHGAADAPEHTMTGDERAVLAQIVASLSMEGHTDTQHVDILVQGSRAILRGTVPGPSTSARIEDVVGSVAGITEVWNELEIIPTDPTR